MKPSISIAAVLLVGASLPALAQGTAPPREAAQFDFLVGLWEIEVTPKVNGLAAMVHGTPHLVGSWKAWRAFDGWGIDDELRIVDTSANPVALSHSMRVYDDKTHQWAMSTLDVYRARISVGQGTWQGGAMQVGASGTSPEGKSVLTRTRFDEIGPDHFRMRQDRSLDNGASWDEGVLTIVARRMAAKAAR